MRPTRSFVACPNDYLLASNEICREHGLYLSRNPVKYALRFDNHILAPESGKGLGNIAPPLFSPKDRHYNDESVTHLNLRISTIILLIRWIINLSTQPSNTIIKQLLNFTMHSSYTPTDLTLRILFLRHCLSRFLMSFPTLFQCVFDAYLIDLRGKQF